MNKVHRPKLPKETQKTAAWYVKLWPRYVLQREAIINASHVPEVPGGTKGAVGDPTGRIVVQLERISKVLDAIDFARKCLPSEFQAGVWNNAILGSNFPDYADLKTWKAYKNDFLYEVAIGLGLPLQ